MFGEIDTRYESLAKKSFDLGNELGTEVRHAMSEIMQMPETNTDIIMTASNAATALFEYSALLLRNKLKKEYGDEYEYESQDNEMIEAYATTLMIPPIALHKIITKQDDPEFWRSLLKKMPIPGIDIDYYLEEAEKIIENA